MKGSMQGLLVLDKPGGVTSRDAVNQVQRWFPRGTRVGHTGTLDPLATGVLVVCIGPATRLAEYVQAMDKVYETSLILGATSDTDDADGTITPTPDSKLPTKARIAKCLQEFEGEISQVPPAYSAAKVTGTRAYALARRGEEVELQPRRIRIYEIVIVHHKGSHLDLRVHCGKGTYIRSLARDLGQQLGCGAYVKTLRRMRVGPFTTENALTLETPGTEARLRLLPLAAAVQQMPQIKLPAEALQRLAQGLPLPLGAAFRDAGLAEQVKEAAVLNDDGALAAVVRVEPLRDVAIPVKVMIR